MVLSFSFPLSLSLLCHRKSRGTVKLTKFATNPPVRNAQAPQKKGGFNCCHVNFGPSSFLPLLASGRCPSRMLPTAAHNVQENMSFATSTFSKMSRTNKQTTCATPSPTKTPLVTASRTLLETALCVKQTKTNTQLQTTNTFNQSSNTQIHSPSDASAKALAQSKAAARLEKTSGKAELMERLHTRSSRFERLEQVGTNVFPFCPI